MLPLYVAYGLMLAFAAIVMATSRARVVAAPGERSERTSGMVLGLAHVIILAAAIVFPALGVGRLALAPAFAWAAVAVMVAAALLQLWSMRTLGAHFRLILGTTHDQPLVERGPYRLVRHPGYLAQIVFFVAFGAATRNGVALAVIVAAVAIGYGWRIAAEERMMARAFGERWQAYAERRARLVPFVF